MKLEHLIQAYKVNNIEAELKEMNNEKEKAGVITFRNGIAASYLLDKEDIVISMKMFFNCLNNEDFNIKSQVKYTIKVIEIIQKTIQLLSNVIQKESNMILEKLGLFDNTFKDTKQIKHLEHTYRVEVMSGILCFSINEI